MLRLLRLNFVDLPVNISLNYFWCSGFMISGFMVIQIVTGIVLSLLYSCGVDVSFACVMGFTNEALSIWLVRYAHIWGATFLFLLIYIHIGRGLYYSSYSKIAVWNVGFVLYLVMMVEAFLGYILPWHQMSYWAATVLTSVIGSVPMVGGTLYQYIVGGFSVGEPALVRVLSVHICLAFLIVGLSMLHLFYLHESGSNNPLFIVPAYGDVTRFHSLFTLKDGFAFMCCLNLFFGCMWLCPDLVVDVEAYIKADPLVTPMSIKPEWYFLSFYAMLRSFESKIGGLLIVLGFLLVLWLPTYNKACCYYKLRELLFWSMVSLFFLLSYVGCCHPAYPYILVGKVSSILLIFFLCLFKGLWLVPYSYGFSRWPSIFMWR